MNYDGYSKLVIGNNRLKGRSHFTTARFVEMIMKMFNKCDVLIIESNNKTEYLTIQVAAIVKGAMDLHEEKRVETKEINGKEVEVTIRILEKPPAIRLQ